MDYSDHVDAIADATARFADALERVPPEQPVPSCAEWTMADLAQHVGEFTGFWAHVLCEGTGRPKPDVTAGPYTGRWYRGVAEALLTELRETPPTTQVWSWAPDDQNAAFVARRCAHELAIHAFDAELAAGPPAPIDPALASDGIDEVFMMIGVWGPPAGCGDGQTMHLHGTDRPDEWLVRLSPDGLEVERAHAKGDLALRGAVSDLELLLYQRPALGTVERFGDEAVLDAWHRAFQF